MGGLYYKERLTLWKLPMIGDLDNPVSDKIYVAVTNQSGTTQAISVNLTILKLEV